MVMEVLETNDLELFTLLLYLNCLCHFHSKPYIRNSHIELFSHRIGRTIVLTETG